MKAQLIRELNEELTVARVLHAASSRIRLHAFERRLAVALVTKTADNASVAPSLAATDALQQLIHRAAVILPLESITLLSERARARWLLA